MLSEKNIDNVLQMFSNTNLSSEVGRKVIIDKILELANDNSNENSVELDYNATEHCIMCNEETEYKVGDDINIRYGYVEGAGQVCAKCMDYGF